MASYETASPEALGLATELAREPGRNMARLKLAVVFARSESGVDLPPIQIKPTGPLYRAGGSPDVLIVIAADVWQRRSTLGKLAMLDHALTSLRVVEHGGKLALDCAGRPRLRRAPRTCPTGYLSVWERWGAASIEAEAFAELRRSAPRDPSAKPRSKPTDFRPDTAQPGGI